MSTEANEHALLAKDSYKDRTRDKDENKIVTIGDRNYRILDTENDRLTGYQGTAYQKLDGNGHPTGEVIIAHRGSEFDRELFKDGFIADGGMILSGFNAQASTAKAFTERAIAKARVAAEDAHMPANISVTGHSLGGTLAELTAHKFHLHGVTFNAYGAADLGYQIPEGGDLVTNYVRATDVVSAASHHFGKIIVVATADDIRQLEHNGYHNYAAARNPLGAINAGAHSITNFVDQPGRPSDLSAENEARARAYQSSSALYRADIRDLRANVFSLAWRLEQKQETALTLGSATATALLHGDRDIVEKLTDLAAHRTTDNLQHAAHVASNTAMLGIRTIDQTGAYMADNLKQGVHDLNQAMAPVSRVIDQAADHLKHHADHLVQHVQQVAQNAVQTMQPFVHGVAHHANAARGVSMTPAYNVPSSKRSAPTSLHDQVTPQQRDREKPAPEHEAVTAQRIDISAITPHSSIEAMFDALYQASVTQDYDAMSAVSQAYLQSPHGQAFLQEGREYNRRLEMQQQMARRGPAMRR